MNKQAQTAVLEARQSMIRVWLAISAVWVAFWLIIAALVLAAFKPFNPLVIQLGIFALIVATPPFVLFAVGAVSRWIFETVTLRRKVR
jgi:hypothetical protein